MNPSVDTRACRRAMIWSFDVFAQIAAPCQRPELLAALQLASDLGEIDESRITTELFGDTPHIGRSIFARCIELGLLDAIESSTCMQLSTTGIEALATGEVFIPQTGLWRLYLGDDVALAGLVLHIEPGQSERARSVREALRDPRARATRQKEVRRSCEVLGHGRGHGSWRSVLNGRVIRIDALADRGRLTAGGFIELDVERAHGEEQTEPWCRGWLKIDDKLRAFEAPLPRAQL